MSCSFASPRRVRLGGAVEFQPGPRLELGLLGREAGGEAAEEPLHGPAASPDLFLFLPGACR